MIIGALSPTQLGSFHHRLSTAWYGRSESSQAFNDHCCTESNTTGIIPSQTEHSVIWQIWEQSSIQWSLVHWVQHNWDHSITDWAQRDMADLRAVKHSARPVKATQSFASVAQCRDQLWFSCSDWMGDIRDVLEQLFNADFVSQSEQATTIRLVASEGQTAGL